MTDINMFGWEMDEAGIVTLTMDDPTQHVNTMNTIFRDSLVATVARLEAEKDKIKVELEKMIKETPGIFSFSICVMVIINLSYSPLSFNSTINSAPPN